MARQRRASTKYRVLNPRSIPDNVPILTLKGGLVLYEGQTFAPPAGIDVTRLLERGFIERA